MKRVSIVCIILAMTSLGQRVATAQAPLPAVPAPSFAASELDRIVSPVALYPDVLLAQVLAAAGYADDIPEAAQWADQHHYLTGSGLSAAIAEDQLPWDPSVQALLPFPSVLAMMAADLPWTRELGDAFVAERAGVMDAVQRLRQQAHGYGYLHSTPQVVVTDGPYIEVRPVSDDFIVVPYYDPLVVFARPRAGVVVASVINFHVGVRLGAAFGPWGWGATRFAWPTHTVIINRAPWMRTWSSRTTYVHPYAVPRYSRPRAPERHRLVPRTEHDRRTEHGGRHRR